MGKNNLNKDTSKKAQSKKLTNKKTSEIGQPLGGAKKEQDELKLGHVADNADTIIKVDDISMRFNLAKEKTESIKEYFIKRLRGKLKFDEFYALRDITLDIKRGESVALIGKNGSGKSTLLKCIAGVMYPTKGNIIVNGSIAPMIELGAGFDMDLTAHENIYLNGAVMGHDRAYMDEHYEDIINFAELRDFVDVPVKNFSSGMVARLGFAIATEVKADIVICDEVLSVGDAAFQQKCLDRLKNMINSGSTLLFVSHSSDMVKKLCRRAVWIDSGRVVADGAPEEVCDKYSESMGVLKE
jgi:ABC-type polysaccharide/polyol phosphate transport system ATPase subunit